MMFRYKGYSLSGALTVVGSITLLGDQLDVVTVHFSWESILTRFAYGGVSSWLHQMQHVA